MPTVQFELRRLAYPRIRDALGVLGWRQCTQMLLAAPLTEDTRAWMGLSFGLHRAPPDAALLLVLGVRHERVERLNSEFLERPYHRCYPPTVKAPVLGPDGRVMEWHVYSEDDIEPVAAEIVAAVARSVEQYCVPRAALPRMAEALAAHEGPPSYSSETRLPLVLELMGEHAEASRILDATVERVAHMPEYGTLIRTFATNFQARFGP